MHARIREEEIDKFFMKEVVSAWETTNDELEYPCRAPLLEDVYDEYYLTMINYVEEMLEEEFGELENSEMAQLIDRYNIDFSNIPPLPAVRVVLDLLGLPYECEGRLYGFAQTALF